MIPTVYFRLDWQHFVTVLALTENALCQTLGKNSAKLLDLTSVHGGVAILVLDSIHFHLQWA